MTEVDNVNHPSHYADGWSNGAEVIDITENLNFNRGNAVKYIARAGKKDPAKELEDLQKAEFYLKREIQLVTKRWDNPPTYQVDVEPLISFVNAVVDVKPRVWDSLTEVPIDVTVTDVEGDDWLSEGPDGSHVYDEYGPFTEILSDG